MKHLPMIGVAMLLAACGDSGTQNPSAPSGATVENPPALPAAPIVQTATRDDVIHALRCHLSLSSAMVEDIASDGPPSRRYGAAMRHWHGRIDQLADAAGISKADRKEMHGQVFEKQRKTPEPKAFVDACYTQAPGE